MATKKKEVQAVTAESIERFIIESGSDHVPTFGGSFEGGIQAQQVPDEFAACIMAMIDSGGKVKSYLEIGAAAGGSVFIMNHYFGPRIVIVDNNQHPKAHIRPYVLRDIPHDEIVGNSHDETTVEAVRSLGVTFDAIMIDGDHYYEGVKADIENYAELLKPGGFLIFHDSQVGAPYGCYKVAMDLKKDSRWEIVGEYIGADKICGILLLRKADVDED